MKTVISTLEDVAEPLRGEYEARNGKFFLKVEGDYLPLIEANTKIAEFRDRNILLLKENDDLRPLKTKYEGIDPEEAKSAIAKVKALGKKGINDAEEFDTRVKSTVDELLKPLREQVAASAAETAAERKRADEFLLHSQVADKFAKLGGRAKAIDQVVTLAASAFEVKDKAVVAKTGKFSVTKPGDVLSVDEWLDGVVKEYDFLFEPSGGGGARPAGGAGGAGGGAKPGALKIGQTLLKDPTPQELGQFASDIAKGKVKVEYSEATH